MTLLGNKTLVTQEKTQREIPAGLITLHRIGPMTILKAFQIPNSQRHLSNKLLL